MSGRFGTTKFEPLSFNENQDSDAFFDDDSDGAWQDDTDDLDNLLESGESDDNAYGGWNTNGSGDHSSFDISVPISRRRYNNQTSQLCTKRNSRLMVLLLIIAIVVYPTSKVSEDTTQSNDGNLLNAPNIGKNKGIDKVVATGNDTGTDEDFIPPQLASNNASNLTSGIQSQNNYSTHKEPNTPGIDDSSIVTNNTTDIKDRIHNVTEGSAKNYFNGTATESSDTIQMSNSSQSTTSEMGTPDYKVDNTTDQVGDISISYTNFNGNSTSNTGLGNDKYDKSLKENDSINSSTFSLDSKYGNDTSTVDSNVDETIDESNTTGDGGTSIVVEEETQHHTLLNETHSIIGFQDYPSATANEARDNNETDINSNGNSASDVKSSPSQDVKLLDKEDNGSSSAIVVTTAGNTTTQEINIENGSDQIRNKTEDSTRN